MRICVVWPSPSLVTETFISAQIDRLPAEIVVTGGETPLVNGRNPLHRSLPVLAIRKVRRMLTGWDWQVEVTARYASIFHSGRPDVVLAEYGPTGVMVHDACRIAR